MIALVAVRIAAILGACCWTSLAVAQHDLYPIAACAWVSAALIWRCV